MVANFAKEEEINVLASGAGWGWPVALEKIFRPRGINLLVANGTSEFVNILESKRVHTTIVDMGLGGLSGLSTIKVIRMGFPRLPCILLAGQSSDEVLAEALRLEVSGVVGKPVNMEILRRVLDRIFVKRYESGIFAENISAVKN